MKFIDYLKWELHPFRLCLSHKNWQSFSSTPWLPCSWQFQSLYLVYRWIFAIFFFAWIFPIGLASENDQEKFFLFLTNWSYMAWVTYLIWSAFSSTATYLYFHFFCQNRFSNKFNEATDGGRFASNLLLDDKPVGCCGFGNDQTLWHQKVQWLLFNVSTSTAIGIVILFWALIYDPERADELDYEVTGGVNLMTHFVNGLGTLIDVFVSGIPVHLLHFVYPMAFSGVYSVFTGVYHAVNGTNTNGDPYIYPVIDYGASPGLSSAVVLLTVLLYVPLMHMFMYCMYLVREGLIYLARVYCCKRISDTNWENLDTFTSDSS